MIVIAILLLAAIVVVTGGVAVGAEQDATFDVFGETVRASGWEVFAVGATCGFVLPIALWLLRLGTRRAAVRRRKAREMRAAHERERAELARQREELETERNQLRNGGDLVRSHVGTGGADDRSADHPSAERDVADRSVEHASDQRLTPDRPGRSAEDWGRNRLTGEAEQPTSRFDVHRPGGR